MNKGGTLIELIMVMLLLILFGVSISSLIYSGSQTQEKIISEKNSQIDARIAVSYMNMKIRQSDTAGMISVKKNPTTGTDSVLIEEHYEWGSLDTWIFWEDGVIYECLVYAGEEPSAGRSEVIAHVDSFDAAFNNAGAIVCTFGYSINGIAKQMRSYVYLRSGA